MLRITQVTFLSNLVILAVKTGLTETHTVSVTKSNIIVDKYPYKYLQLKTSDQMV